jgi:hypothetical protein
MRPINGTEGHAFQSPNQKRRRRLLIIGRSRRICIARGHPTLSV